MNWMSKRKKDRLEHTLAMMMYLEMRDNAKLANKVREAETEEEMVAVLQKEGFFLEPDVLDELVRLFARELTDEDLVLVTGG